MTKQISFFLFAMAFFVVPAVADFEPIPQNNPGLTVDLGVGLWAWPVPMDYDGDGDLDLVVSCVDKPYNGLYFFENPGGDAKMPVFKPAVRLRDGLRNVQSSFIGGTPRVLTPGTEWTGIKEGSEIDSKEIHPEDNVHGSKIRANQWKYVDYDGDGALDLVSGVGDWADYGWDNAFDEEGNWTRGPLHGYIYLMRNKGSDDAPDYAKPTKLEAGGVVLDVYGMPSPNFEDFDGDGDLDIICGNFIDSFTWFENIGSRTEPVYAVGRKLQHDGEDLRMELCMIVPTAVDWDGDGDHDLIVGEEDGRVAFLEHAGMRADNMPQFLPPVHFQQEAENLKFGALVTPWSVDWDGDGDEDLICGNTAGHVGFIENLDGGNPPRWARPVYLEAGGEKIRIMAGPNGSIQGPCEEQWGYTTLSVADWDGDGLYDVIANSIWGIVVWFRNIGEAGAPALAEPQPVQVAWEGDIPSPAWNWWKPEPGMLSTQWRTTPVAIDLDNDKDTDLVMLDHEGYLAFFERKEASALAPPQRIFLDDEGNPLRLNEREAGKSGRRKICLVDWDGDGDLDLFANSVNIDWYQNIAEEPGEYRFKHRGKVGDRLLAGHTTSPTIVDWDKNDVPDLLAGAEDGFFYYLANPRSTR